ncbi:DUF4835 family protein [Hymenobacter sp. ASUV-10]|uniref:DUF4835 family protein n=1 Tax=Hymenobacter aranciens TaxID=3063996 RepID=A0ABT9B970_9BACT|nr:DUF4835 family protein [Hymenobacter sp. ASUV-10]MDO7874208.1 DUF4835 family protein [Hymenobacter sp. ASUV-10]
MMRKILTILPLLALLAFRPALAQELLADVKVSTQNVTVSDPTLINQMQNDMQSMLNTRAWTDETYRPEERIKFKMFVGITEIPTNGTYKATMRLVSTRPIYGTGYETNVVSFVDRDFVFNYSPQQPLDFSRNSFVSNLSSLLGFYAYIVIGIDHDTYSRLGGSPYYDLARNIVNYSANQTTTNEQDAGWKDAGSRNRYWILNNLTDPQLEAFRTGLYGYYRQGMDIFIEKPDDARAAVMTALTGVQKAAITRPGTLFARAFFDAKAEEISNIFRTSTDQSQKQQLVSMLTEVDPTNSAKYQTVLK